MAKSATAATTKLGKRWKGGKGIPHDNTWFSKVANAPSSQRLLGHAKSAHGGQIMPDCKACQELSLKAVHEAGGWL